MNLIKSITDNANQIFSVSISGYSNAQITLNYKSNQNAWFMSIVWGSFEINNMLISVGYNILRQFKNQIPFGIAINSTTGTDPLFVDSWLLGYNNFYVLDSTDVAFMETTYYG